LASSACPNVISSLNSWLLGKHRREYRGVTDYITEGATGERTLPDFTNSVSLCTVFRGASSYKCFTLLSLLTSLVIFGIGGEL